MGFSYIGLIVVCVILLPNLLFMAFPPQNVPLGLKGGNILLTVMERAGQVGFIIIPIISYSYFSGIAFNIFTGIMIFSAIMYYGLWIRYFVRGREFYLLFKPLGVIPVPMAVFPIIYMLFSAIWLRHMWLGAAAVIFAVGHYFNSRKSYKHAIQNSEHIS